LEKGIKPKGKDFTSMLVSFTPFPLNNDLMIIATGFYMESCYLCLYYRNQNNSLFFFQKVDYPLELDVYEFCSDELKQKLQAPRQVLSLFTIQF